jgi:hypothetical protein
MLIDQYFPNLIPAVWPLPPRHDYRGFYQSGESEGRNPHFHEILSSDQPHSYGIKLGGFEDWPYILIHHEKCQSLERRRDKWK